MATIAGNVKSLSNGIFNVKDENGNVRVLKVGDEIYENDTVYGESNNTSSSQIEIQLSGNDVIVLSEGQQQLIDSSLIETAFGTEELFFTIEGIDLKADEYNSNADVVSDLRDAEFKDEKKEVEEEGAVATAANGDITEEDTAEGEEEAEDEESGSIEFEGRDGNVININTDLREAQFVARTQTFEELTQFESESEGRLTPNITTERPNYRDSIVNTPSISTVNPTPPSINSVDITEEEVVNTPFISTVNSIPASINFVDNVKEKVVNTPSVPTVNPTPPSVVPVDNTEEEVDNIEEEVVETPISTPIIGNLSINNATNYENDEFLIFTVTLDRSLSSSVTFDYETTAITASANGEDYSDISGSITIPAGSISTTIQVPIRNDYISDNGETLRINISNIEGNANISNSEAIGTILDNVDTAIVSISGDELVQEGSTAIYKIEVDQVIASGETITVPLTYSYISASSEDIITNTVQIILDENNQSVNFNIETINDALAEGSEVFNVTIGAPIDTGSFENIDLGSNTVSTIIEDNTENAAVLSLVGPANVIEGETTTAYTLSVDQLATDVKTDITVTFTYTGVAVDGTDFTGVASQVIVAGTNSTTFDITTLDDALTEEIKSFSIAINTITDTNFEAIVEHVTNNSVTTIITDDRGIDNPAVDSDVTATVIVDDAKTVREEDGVYLTYNVKLSNAVGENVDVTLATSGTATADSDYKSNLEFFDGASWAAVLSDRKITLPADATTIQVRVEVLDDAVTESNETVILSVTTTDSQITDSSDTGLGNITEDLGTNPVDEDITVTVVVGDALTVEEANGIYLTYDVKLSNAVGENVDVTLATSGTATADSDYKSNLEFFDGTSWVAVPSDGKITLLSDASKVQVRAEVLDDRITESNETVILSATTTDTQITASSDTGSGIITDEYTSTAENTIYVKLTQNDTIYEGDDLTHTLTLIDSNGIAITPESGTSITVNLEYPSDLDKTESSDFTSKTIKVTIGDTGTATITNKTFNDSLVEGSESYTLKITNVVDDNSTYEKVEASIDSVTGIIYDNLNLTPDTSTVEEGLNTISGNLLTNDEVGYNGKITSFKYIDGSGEEQTGTLGTQVNTKYGSLFLSENGDWNFISDTSEYHSDTMDLIDIITYIVSDGTSNGNATLKITITDDIPIVEVNTTTIIEPIIQVDETDLTVNKTADFSVNFEDTTLDAGKDGQKTLTKVYTLGVISGDSGLVDTLTAEAIILSVNASGEVEGKTQTSEKLVFTVSVNSSTGVVTLNQDRAIKHSDATDSNDVSTTITDNFITLTKTNTLTDNDEDIVSDSATINIGSNISFLDDTPTAKDNSAIVEEGKTTTIIGNVITDNDSRNGKDVSGADGIDSLSKFTYTKTDGSSETLTFSDTNTTYTKNTPTGSLTVNQDGTWSFTPIASVDHDASVSEGTLGSFDYTVVDGDGDTSSATNTITVTDTAPTIGTVITVSVDEDDLSTIGSDTDKESLTVSASLAVSQSQDAIDTIFNMSEDDSGLTSNGNTVYYYLFDDSKELTASTSTTKVGVDASNTIFTDTLSDTTSNTAKHTFVLSGVIDHVNANGENTTELTFNYKVTDIDGSEATNSFQVDVVDDVPTAVADKNTIVEGVTIVTVTTVAGDVIYGDVADTQGADTHLSVVGVVAGTTITNSTSGAVTDVRGAYGSVNIVADGTYTYTLDNTNLDVQHLVLAETLTDTFVYTIKDQDGDMSSQTLSVTITATDDGVTVTPIEDYTGTDSLNTDQVVYESGLATGSSINVSNTEVDSSFTIEALDGLAVSDAVTFSGTGFSTSLTKAQIEALSTTSQSVTTEYGTLVLDGYTQAIDGVITLDYTYTLTSAPDVTGTDTMDNILITATDRGGSLTTDSDTLSIKIVDDAPTAVNDANIDVVEGALAISANVITTGTGADTVGADGATVHTFTYTNTSDTATTVTFSDANPQTVVTKDGSLTVNPNGDWSFKPNDSIDHDDTGSLGSFSYTLIDGDGDISNSATQTITVTDTDPSATAIDASVNENDLAGGSTPTPADLIVKKSLGITKSQDDIADVTFETSTITSLETLGLKSNGMLITYVLTNTHTITASADGNNIFSVVINNPTDTTGTSQDYTFTLIGTIDHLTADSTNQVDLTFTFDVTDIDSTVKNNTFKVSVIDDVPIANADTTTLTVNEGNVALTGMIDLLANDVSGADGLSTVTGFTYTDEEGNEQTGTLGTEVDTQYGLLTVNSDGSWSYTSDGSEINNTAAVTDNFTYTITDFDGDISSAIQEIKVTDGANPTNNGATSASLDEDDLSSGSDTDKETLTATGDLNITSGTDALDTVFDTTGTGTLTSNGIAIVYTLSDDGHIITGKAGSKEIFVATITDPDNETASTGYTFELKGTIDHDAASGENSEDVVLHYIATDADGDSAANDLTVAIIDDITTIGTADTDTVDEANLASGSNPDNAALTQIGSLAVNKDADSFDTTFSTSQTDLNALNLTSQGTALSYTISLDGHTLTAKDISDITIFTVTITDPTTTSAGYSFKLSGVLDNSEETTVLPFSYQVVDYDGDSINNTFIINVLDDNPSIQDYTIDEDSEEATYATQAGTTSSNTSIDTSPTHGTASIGSDGKLHYEPNDNYSGTDTLIYTVVEDNISTSTTVTFTVNPISDAPGVTADTQTVYTFEDTAVALGFKAPTVTDSTDLNDADAADNPELLSSITLSGIPDGAQLLKANGEVIFTGTSTDDTITIVLSDATNQISGVTGDLTMTIDEFEALKFNPTSQSADNPTITMSVTEYEVDDSGVQIDGVNGATSTEDVLVDVLAVTDTPTLTIDGAESKAYSFSEDTTLDITDDLVDSFIDLDSSEEYTYIVSGLEEGTEVVIGSQTYIADNTGTITSTESTIDAINENPTFTITPPKNFSGDMSTITITLVAHDVDTDSTNSDSSTEGTTTLGNTTIYDSKDSVTLSLYVKPVADDIADMSAKTTNEDTSVVFLNDLALTDTDTNGKESITKLVISGLDEESIITYNGESTTIDSSGEFIIGNGTIDLDISTIQASTIQAPAHSSSDMSITVTATVKDIEGSIVNRENWDKTFNIIVNPIAESTQTNTAGDSANDIITQGDHTYTATVNEDEYFALNTADSNFALSLTNEDDSSETTFVLFTPKDVDAVLLIGTSFRYDSNNDGTLDTTIIYDGTSVEIPSTALDTLQVKAPAEYSGTMILTTQIKSIDYDDDSTNKESSSIVTSEGDTLTITVDPIADNVTVAIKQSFGDEDAGRKDNGVSGIELNVGVTSSDKDGSESYTLKLSDISDGAQIYYNGQLVTLSSSTITEGSANSTTNQFSGENFELISTDSDNSDGTWELEIKNFDKTKLFAYIPEENSNENITLKVQAQSVDGSDVNPVDLTTAPKLDILVKVIGDADTVNDRELNTVSSIDIDTGSNDYNSIVEEDTPSVKIIDLFTNTTSTTTALNLVDSDGSETLFIKITDVPTGFTISGTNVVQIGNDWLVDRVNFDDVVINIPSDYSGEVEFNLSLQTVENDGSKLINTIKVPISILVTPIAESSVNNSDSQSEDVTTANILDFTFNQVDINETLESIFINTATIDDGVTLHTTNQGDLVKTTDDNWVELTVTNGVVETVTSNLDSSWADVSGSYDFDIKYTVKDTADDSESNTYDNSVEKETTYTVTVNAVTDTATSSISDIFTTQESDATITGTGTDADKYTVSIKDNTTITLPFVLTPDDMASENNGADDDGSEKVLTSVTITGVPEGVGVVDGVYQGDVIDSKGNIVNSGNWTLELDATYLTLGSDGATNNIEFTVDGENVTFNEFTGANTNTATTDDDNIATITITVNHKDGSSSTLSNSKSFELELADDSVLGTVSTDADVTVDNFNGSSMDLTIASNETIHMTEDQGIVLSDMLTFTDGDTTGDISKFSIIIKDLPEGLKVSGMTYNSDLKGYILLSDTISSLDDTSTDGDGRLNGEGTLSDIQAALASITIAPDSNNNDNNYPDSDFDFNVEVLTYNSESQTPNTYGTSVSVDIAPVSDKTTISISGNDVNESATPTAQTITLNLSNSADDSRVIVIGDKVYVKFTESYTDDDTGMLVGTITYDENPVSDLTVVDGYYEITGITDLSTDITFEYTPAANYYGTLVVDSKITTQENTLDKTNSEGTVYITNEITTTASKTITISPFIDIPDETSTTPYLSIIASGNEGELSMLSITTTSIDASENITGAVLDDVPYGYEVYNDEVLQVGIISGVDIAGSYLYKYTLAVSDISDLNKIGIKAPDEDDATTLEDISLSVTITEGSASKIIETNVNFEFIAVADDLISFNPTTAISDEYVNSSSQWTQINLNVNVQDTDKSETISVTFDGLLEGTTFSLDESTAYTDVSYDSATGIYTVANIAYDKINSLYIQTPIGYKGGIIQTTAWTVEIANSDTSTVKTGSFDIELESKASGVTSFTSNIGNQIDTSKNNIISSGYSIALYVTSLDLLDKDGSESLYLKVSGLNDSFDLDVSSITGVIVTQNTSDDWIINIGNASDSTYEDALIALANGDIKLISTSTNGSVENIDISAYSQLEKNSDEKSDEVVVNNVALNVTVNTTGSTDGTSGDDNIIGSDNDDTINAGTGNDTINAGAGNDTIITDGLDIIDGGTGYDTVQLESSANFDFLKLDNIEDIDLTSGNHTISLSLQDVIDMTDSGNILKIIGDSNDSVLFDMNKWSTTSTSSEDGATFDIYTNTDDTSVQVKVEQIITDGITN